MHQRRCGPVPRWAAWVISVLMFSLVLPMTTAGLAQAAPRTLKQAVAGALEAAGRRAPDRVHVVPAVERKGWSFGTAALLGTERDGGPPDVVFYVAERTGGVWRAEVEPAAAYFRLLRQAPAGMIPDVFLPLAGGLNAQAWGNDKTGLPLSMPVFPSTWRLEEGPHVDNPDRSTNGAPWSAIDFTDRDENGGMPILAAAPGFATAPCTVNEDDGGPLVIIQHANGWRTTYFHMYGTFPSNLNKQVKRFTPIGFMGPVGGAGCAGGEVYPPQLHFSLRRVDATGDRGVDLNGVFIGGWEVVGGAAEFQGCLRKRLMDGPTSSHIETVCTFFDPFPTGGEIGQGATLQVKPGTVVAGQEVRVIVNKVLPLRYKIVYYWRHQGREYSKMVRTFDKNNSEKGISMTFRQPHWVQAQSARLCIEGNFGQFDDLIVCETVRVRAN